MLQHYLKIAFRNLWKYKTQSIISIIGLAVGVACFALTSLWIRYEMTYDSFHKEADRIYMVYVSGNTFEQGGTGPYALAGYLKENFPEVEDALTLSGGHSFFQPDIKIDGRKYNNVSIVDATSSFPKFFPLSIVAGDPNFLVSDSGNAAITRKKAKEIFGDESPIGKKIVTQKELTITTIVEEPPVHSNYYFDILIPLKVTSDWEWSHHWRTLIKISPATNVKAFERKLAEHSILRENPFQSVPGMKIIPLKEVRFKDPSVKREVKFQYITYFSLLGLLLIICSLTNYITLFMSRFQMRQKELALRKVCGSSEKSLLVLLSVEFAISLLFACIIGLVTIKLILPYFYSISGIELGLSAIYLELFLYIAFIILFSLLIFIGILLVFRKRSLQVSIKKQNLRLFNKASLLFQLFISMGIIFCAFVFFKQIHFLHHTDLGFAYKNILLISFQREGSISTDNPENPAILAERLKKETEIESAIYQGVPLLPRLMSTTISISEWEGKSPDEEGIFTEMTNVNESYFHFYDLKLAKGSFFEKGDRSNVLINEALAKRLKMEDPVGKKIWGNRIIKGVIKDVYFMSPTSSPDPIIFFLQDENMMRSPTSFVLVKYVPESKKTIESKIRKIIDSEFPDIEELSVSFAEENYDNYFSEEKILMRILGVISFVCILISVLGFFSLISLDLEARRKEIAVRKINGASMKDIFEIILRSYFVILLLGSLLAFPVGSLIMKRWLEQYSLQTSLDFWIYLAVFWGFCLIIFLTVGRRVYQVSRINPIEALKRE